MGDPSERVMAIHARGVIEHLSGASDATGPSGATGPVNAITLGRRLNLKGGREALRRAVRRFVEHARSEMGQRICADTNGYWLARDADEWREYKAACKGRLRFKFYQIKKKTEAIAERMSGQGRLFDRPREGSRAAWAMA